VAFQIIRKDSSQHIVYGWGSASIAHGDTVVDLQDDAIAPEELEQMVTAFMLNSRESGVMHEGEPVGRVIASLVTMPDVMKAFFGDQVPDVPIGWILGVKIENQAAWQQVLDGTLKAFSIQGTAERIAE
jgi:hypothetical protein